MTTWFLAEFDEPEAMLAAARSVREQQWGEVDIHAPYPVHGIGQTLGLRRSPIPLIVLCAALAGATFGFLLQWYLNAVNYPINVGGRPLNSWPMFIPITFESAVLAGGTTAFFGLLALARLPQVYHPVFELERFRRATRDRFWISLAALDRVDGLAVLDELRRLGALQVARVEEPSP